MYPAPFEYLRPATIDEAIALLVTHGEDAKILAGGHSLIPAMKLRLAQPRYIVDIGRIRGMSHIRETAGRIVVGAMATHDAIERSALLREKCPLLPETAGHIGDVQVRNKGTIGGSLAHADPAGDWPAAVLALDADIELAGPRGRRTVKADGFFVDLLTTATAPDEVLVEIRVPITSAKVAYEKTEQKASGFAIAGVAVVVEQGGVRVGVTGVAAKAYRAKAVERALAGQSAPTAEGIARAAALAAERVEALGDIHASPEYRLHLAEVNTARALRRAYGN
ncbi:MAG: carbon monoxide dehydrogenase [Acidobacteria bacterium RIFCSPLOWO2_02_FULL_65_29]|nr:MAG: carbon monoxide dehydrogenase [Acidobacteria bacterium RIFCSPLOWO2_02_FULL_65_29]